MKHHSQAARASRNRVPEEGDYVPAIDRKTAGTRARTAVISTPISQRRRQFISFCKSSLVARYCKIASIRVSLSSNARNRVPLPFPVTGAGAGAGGAGRIIWMGSRLLIDFAEPVPQVLIVIPAAADDLADETHYASVLADPSNLRNVARQHSAFRRYERGGCIQEIGGRVLIREFLPRRAVGCIIVRLSRPSRSITAHPALHFSSLSQLCRSILKVFLTAALSGGGRPGSAPHSSMRKNCGARASGSGMARRIGSPKLPEPVEGRESDLGHRPDEVTMIPLPPRGESRRALRRFLLRDYKEPLPAGVELD